MTASNAKNNSVFDMRITPLLFPAGGPPGVLPDHLQRNKYITACGPRQTVHTLGQSACYARSMAEYLARWDVFVRYEELPAQVHGFACAGEGAEGVDQIAVINDGLEGDELINACAHEIAHHVDGDRFKDGEKLEDIERHGKSKKTR